MLDLTGQLDLAIMPVVGSITIVTVGILGKDAAFGWLVDASPSSL